jgi:hypothetical protein
LPKPPFPCENLRFFRKWRSLFDKKITPKGDFLKEPTEKATKRVIRKGDAPAEP